LTGYKIGKNDGFEGLECLDFAKRKRLAEAGGHLLYIQHPQFKRLQQKRAVQLISDPLAVWVP
jgi:hypothetical protein